MKIDVLPILMTGGSALTTWAETSRSSKTLHVCTRARSFILEVRGASLSPWFTPYLPVRAPNLQILCLDNCNVNFNQMFSYYSNNTNVRVL